MKKLLISLVVLAISTSVFARDITISCSVDKMYDSGHSRWITGGNLKLAFMTYKGKLRGYVVNPVINEWRRIKGFVGKLEGDRLVFSEKSEDVFGVGEVNLKTKGIIKLVKLKDDYFILRGSCKIKEQ
jgi:hypothetical protein